MPDQALQWVDADGTATAIRGGSGIAVGDGAQGRFGPSMRFSFERVPLQPGQRLRQVEHDQAEVSLPVVFWPSSPTALRTLLREWGRRLDPVRGDGALRVTAPGGDQRELVCRYSGGLDQIQEDDVSDLNGHVRAVLHFLAEQPYWQDVSDTTQSWSLMSSLATFFPIFPLRLSGSEVFADAVVVNTGDVEAWPVWTITGPGSGLILRTLTAGQLLSLPVTLAGGEIVTIDTRPTRIAVTKQDGSSLFSSIDFTSPTSGLWSLRQGSNSIRLELTAATSASRIDLRFKRRHLSA